jgi:hypothetical protein
MYLSGSKANGWQLNPFKWNWQIGGWGGSPTFGALFDGIKSGMAIGGQLETSYNSFAKQIENKRYAAFLNSQITEEHHVYTCSINDYYTDTEGTIKWFYGSEDRKGWTNIGGGLGSDVLVIGNYKRGFWKAIWHSDLMRNLVIDRITLRLDGNVVPLLGVGMDIELQIMTRGPQAGFSITNSVSQRIGIEGDLGWEFGFSRFNGPPERMFRNTVLGNYYELDEGSLVGVSAYMSFDGNKISWYGASGGFGLTIGASGGYGVTRMGLNDYPSLYP